MQRITSSEHRAAWLEETLPPKVREISQRVKIIRFGVVQERPKSPWTRLAGMFHLGRRANIEEMLDARGFDEAVHDF